MTTHSQEATQHPELTEEFLNVPCHRVLFVYKQLKASLVACVARPLSADVRGGQSSHKGPKPYSHKALKAMKDIVFWNMTPCRSSKDRRFGGTRLLHR
jgi:hypothetical protein